MHVESFVDMETLCLLVISIIVLSTVKMSMKVEFFFYAPYLTELM